MSKYPLVHFQASKEMLMLLVEAVNEKLERWPGGEPAEQETLKAMKQILFVATLEFLMNTETDEEQYE